MNNFLDLLSAIIKLGLPVAGLSWFLFSQLYSSGSVDRKADRKTIKSHIKLLHKEAKANKKQKVNLVYDNWMWFGSGFYGLVALWTFVIVELQDIYNFVFHNPGIEALFSEGLIGLIVNMVINQFQNIVTAFVWFSFWDADSIPLWVLVAYAGYWVGVEMARRDLHTQIPTATWIERIRSMLNNLKS